MIFGTAEGSIRPLEAIFRQLDFKPLDRVQVQCMEAWTAARDEAMKNLGLRDDPEQEGWEKMGPLADPTPANAKNRGAADRKKRRREQNERGNEEENDQRTPAASRAERIGDEEEEA